MLTQPANPIRTLAVSALSLPLLILWSACGSPAPSGQSATAIDASASTQIEVQDARVQLMPGMGAVYLTLINHAPEGDRLLAVETSGADSAELHETREEGGVMRMRGLADGLEVPAGGTVTLEPGGKHIMLVDPRPIPADPARIDLILRFEHAGALVVEAPVSALMDGSEPGSETSGESGDEPGEEASEMPAMHTGEDHEMDHGEPGAP